jgi:hypothetical protein
MNYQLLFLLTLSLKKQLIVDGWQLIVIVLSQCYVFYFRDQSLIESFRA